LKGKVGKQSKISMFSGSNRIGKRKKNGEEVFIALRN